MTEEHKKFLREYLSRNIHLLDDNLQEQEKLNLITNIAQISKDEGFDYNENREIIIPMLKYLSVLVVMDLLKD